MAIKCVMMTLMILLLPAAAVPAMAEPQCPSASSDYQAAVTDAWIKGKVEMALLLNRYLNSFRIATSVKDKHVTLSGNVESEIDKDLAQQIVLGIGGIASIDNQLDVAPRQAQEAQYENDSDALKRIQDVTLTARVKSRLVLNNIIRARNIDVDTHNSTVTLTGTVRNAQERELALQIARNTDDVKSVLDRLQILPSS